MSGEGIDKAWSTMEQFRSVMEDTGELEWRRKEQHLRWMWSYVEERLVTMARESGVNDDNIAKLEIQVQLWELV